MNLPTLLLSLNLPAMSIEQTGMSTPASAGVDLSAELLALEQLDLSGLRVRWRKMFRKDAPDHLGRSLLLRILAYKLQARVHGDLDAESVRYLERIEKERVRRRSAGENKPKQVPTVPAVPARHGFKPGTAFVREFGNEVHTVMVVADGFAWKGAVYDSLSEIARLITGTQWSGPRFFGLRQKSKTTDKPEGSL